MTAAMPASCGSHQFPTSKFVTQNLPRDKELRLLVPQCDATYDKRILTAIFHCVVLAQQLAAVNRCYQLSSWLLQPGNQCSC